MAEFPNNKAEALALLYVQAQDLSNKTPSEINTMYLNAYYEISRDNKAKISSGKMAAIREDSNG